jgi:fibronectin type 3 domain-containing protein
VIVKREAVVRRAANCVVENLEHRRLFAALVPSSALLVFNASTSGPASPVDTLTLTNTGSSTLSFGGGAFTIVRDPADASNEAAQFAITNSGSLPSSLAPGASTQVQIDYTASVANTIQAALLQVTSNDPANPVITVQLHGLGTNGQFGTNEPSLVNVLLANDIPTIVGAGPNDANASNSQYPEVPDPSSQEVAMPRLVKAGSGPITITPLASFNSSVATTVRFGYYTPGDSTAKTELFTIGQVDAQAVNPTLLGATSFDPGSGPFSLYATFPGTTTSDGSLDIHYSESSFNTLDTAHPQKFRFFPLENADGTTVANAYIVAAEDFNNPSFNSFVNFVGIIRNVAPASDATGAPVAGLTNLGTAPGSNQMVFDRIQNGSPDDPQPFTDIVHDTGTLQINNTGDQPLIISSVTLSDTTNWQIVNPPAAGTSIAPGGSLAVQVKFIATSAPSVPYNQTNDTSTTNGVPVLQAGGVWNGMLIVNSNDPVNPTRTVQLAGYWQNESEHENEPGLQTQVNLLYGYGTTISNTEQPNYNNNGTSPVYYGEEVPSGLWNIADSSQPITVLQLGAWHNQYDPTSMQFPAASILWYAQGNSGSSNLIFQDQTKESQSLLPTISGSATNPAFGTFTPTGTFGWNLDGEKSQDSLNTTDINSFGRSGHAVRFYPVRDGSGNLIANTWLVVMDYENSSFDNSDFQDNEYLVTNMRPATQAPAPNDLQATGAANGVTLQWAPVSDGSLIGYNVYSSSSPTGTFTKLNGSPISATSFLDTSAAAGVPAYYHVTAVDSSGESEAVDASGQRLGALTTTLQSQDINSQPSGSTTVVTSGTAYTVTGGGVDIAGAQADGFRYVYQQVNGNFDAEVQVASLTQTVQPNSRAGLMVRESLDAGSQMVFSGATASNGYRFSYRSTEGQLGVFNTVGTVNYPNVWVRLVRKGNVFTTYSSPDGTTWTETGTVEMSLSSVLYLGMVVSSHDVTQTVTAQFQNYASSGTVQLPPPPPPPPGVPPAPAAPSDVSATAASSGITLQWAPEANIAGFEVLRSDSANGTFTELNSALLTGTSFIDTTAPAGATSFYEVVAVDSFGTLSDPTITNAFRPLVTTSITFGGKTLGTYTDAAGHKVTLKLSGPGTGTAVFDAGDANPGSITLTGTTAASVFTITVVHGATTVGTITVTGSLKNLSAPTTELQGDLSVSGSLGSVQLGAATGGHTLSVASGRVGTLNLGRVADLSIASSASIGTLQASSWTVSLGSDVITAPTIGTLTVKGDMAAGLDLTGTGRDLNSATIRGALAGGKWVIAGSAGSIVATSVSAAWSSNIAGGVSSFSTNGNYSGTFAANSVQNFHVGGDLAGSVQLTGGGTALRNLTVGGAINNALVSAAGNIVNVRAAALTNSNVFAGVSSNGLPASSSDFSGSSTITSVVVRGARHPFAVQGSNVAAATLGHITFGPVDTDNGGVPFGLAAHSLASYTRRVNGTLLTWTSKMDPALLTTNGDAVVRLL